MSEPVVFLPGMMADARVFDQQIRMMSTERVVTVAPITLGERIEEIASSILPHLPARFALVGCGMGGIVAMEILRRAQERVARVALMDTDPLAETPQAAAEREPLIVGARAGRLDAVMAETFKPDHLAPGPGRMDVMATLLTMARDLGPDVYVSQSRALQRRRDQQSTLRKIKVPAMVLCGEHDGLTPMKRHSFMAELIPKAKLRVIEGAGHLPSLEQPHATLDALRDWLRQPLILQNAL
ncbi:alpha/beta fold hydrolase [Thalassococcus sp. S3]|uniref:alpha/beta fold hydrolase n=1 Tax=Thalassococcus sp. S3 TaxID=2017482 RepID=UPI001024624D|nr:alpha/beta fold hydrolase [Thalassococcus sp. S3]QBF32782.1 alpha/beta hydrolase [Thalassococcus sp. S3]